MISFGKKKNNQKWQEMLAIVSHSGRLGFKSSQRRVNTPVRTGMLWLILVVFVGILVARLSYIQLFEGERNLLVSENNRLQIKIERAPRGVIYDRNGEILVRNVEDDKYGITREYVLGEAAAHILGYVSEVTDEELGCRRGICYEQGVLVGRTGVEASMEEILRGRDGGQIIEVDAGGNSVRVVGEYSPEVGRDVVLALDVKLQSIMATAMDDRKGAAVVLDMQGRVLGFVSAPSYDPNLFTVREENQILQNLLSDDDNNYFLNRVSSGTYPPGSVYKLVTAYAGLQENAITPDTEIEDTGEVRIGDQYRYGNWYFDQYGRTEGFLNIVSAIGRSNDIFFYKVGELVGVDALVDWSERFGLGQVTGIELAGESEGLVPTPLWKERYVGERWFLGNTYHMAIGQGDILTTPLQIARMTVAVLSGRLCDVTLFLDSQISCKNIDLKSENIGVVWEGMRVACSSGGTAFPLFDIDPYAVCKTGTAQHGDEEEDPHAWITVGYPGENPEFVLTILLESGGEGSAEAGPIAKEILSNWK